MNYNKVDYRKMKEEDEKRIKTIAPNMQNKSGIYVWYRPIYKFYAGQSVSLVDRSVSHLEQHDHLGLSIKKHGLYSEDNPLGWKLTYFYCDKEELDELEKQTIARWNVGENITYNITAGGQCEGKEYIQDIKPAKKYKDGIKQGEKNAKSLVREMFNKYLDISIKGKSNKVKERKLQEFMKWLEEIY